MGEYLCIVALHCPSCNVTEDEPLPVEEYVIGIVTVPFVPHGDCTVEDTLAKVEDIPCQFTGFITVTLAVRTELTPDDLAFDVYVVRQLEQEFGDVLYDDHGVNDTFRPRPIVDVQLPEVTT